MIEPEDSGMQRPHTSAPSRDALASAAPDHRRGERGAVLVNAAIAMIGLLSFSTVVVDYGMLWAARRQAQNAADAGAMAAAVSLAYEDFDNHDLARTSALNTARSNSIWGATPDVTDADVTFPPCPAGSPVASANACVRVDVFRNQRAGGNPLPTILGRLVGVMDQGVRATATAQVLFGDSSTCVKPWAIPDKWEELNPSANVWDPTDKFNAYAPGGSPLTPADHYERPGPGASHNGAGTGFTRESVGLRGSDYGLEMLLKSGNPDNVIAPGWFFPVDVCDGCTAGSRYQDAMEHCTAIELGPGSTLTGELGNMIEATRNGVDNLIAQDPDARWDPSVNGGKGGIAGGCQAAGTCEKSPRLVAVPVFDVDAYDRGKAIGQQAIVITKILGFFIEGLQGNDIRGRLSYYPGPPRVSSSAANIQTASFIVSIALVR